jgi:HEAT repeat protein
MLHYVLRFKDMTKRLWLLFVITMVGLISVGLFLRLHKMTSLIDEGTVYLAKREQIRPLQQLKGKRPFTEEEMKLLRQFTQDPDFRIRVRALSALSYTPDPKQREEAIQIAIKSLNDPWSSVRDRALRLLARQNAKEAVPYIIPLLKDPNEYVRERAKKTLEQLGYKVGE